MKLQSKLVLSLVIVLLLVRCSQDDLSPQIAAEVDSHYISTARDHLSAQLATGLVYAVKYPEVRLKLKNSILEQFDGDYNVLFAQIKNVQLSIERNGRIDQLTFGQLVAEGVGQTLPIQANSNVNSDALTFLESLSKDNPLIQIGIPQLVELSPEDWNADTDQLPVVIVPDKILNEEVPIIYPNGQTAVVSTTEEPNELVLVIRQSERVIALPKKRGAFESIDVGLDCTGEPIFSTPDYDYLMLDDYYDAQNDCSIPNSSGGGSSNNDNPPSPLCDRDTNSKKDELYRMKFTSINNYRWARDGWLNGKIEIKVVITLASEGGTPVTLTKMFVNNENDYRYCGIFDCDPRWVNYSSEIVTWNKDEFGDRMNYFWTEHDGTGDKQETTVSFPVKIGTQTFNITSKVTTNSDDKILGESSVEYCDNTDGDGTSYNPGVIEFQVRQQ